MHCINKYASFLCFIIFIIYSIHLIHLGSRKLNLDNTYTIETSSNDLYRADIVDRNDKFLVKTVSSIDIGISSKKVIDTKKLILNLTLSVRLLNIFNMKIGTPMTPTSFLMRPFSPF